MSSYYSRRPSYAVATWNQRIYPRQHDDDFPVDHQLAATRTTSRSPPPASATPLPDPAATAAPPPIYYPGEAQLARRRATDAGLPPGLASSTNTASSKTTTVEWVAHPTIRSNWRRYIRVPNWWAVLARNESEELYDGWPEAFGGRAMPNREEDSAGDVEGGSRFSRSISRRSGVSAVDSGIALTPRGTMEVQQHVLEQLFKTRIDELNVLIPQHLRLSRVYLALLEMVNWTWLVMLFVALGVTGGKQTRFLQAVELSLVVLIILNGIGVNAVRMRRWALARQLRQRTRDWSPLPITTSSTNNALLNNAGLNAGLHFFGQPDEEALAERTRGKDQPTLRWRMRGIEGSWWLSYRPIIKCELVTPASNGLIAYAAPPAEEPNIAEHPSEAPEYSE